MATGSGGVFISYSHADERWKDGLVSHLRVLDIQGSLDVWDDRRIAAGDDWLEELQESLSRASVFLLLVSADFLTSDFVSSKEIPRLLDRRTKEGLAIIPIIVRACAWQEVAWLREIQVRPVDGRPLAEHRKSGVDVEFAKLAKEIIAILKVKASQSGIGYSDKQQDQEKPSVFICHCEEDADFAENLKNKIGEAGLTAWIDADRLAVGVNWREEIDEAIRSAMALVVVMTPEARGSEYVTYEWSFALGVGVPVVPALLRQTQLHPRLEALQYLDFTNRRARPWPELISALKSNSSRRTPNTYEAPGRQGVNPQQGQLLDQQPK